MISRTVGGGPPPPYAASEVEAGLVGELHKWECLRKTGRGWKVKNKMARR